MEEYPMGRVSMWTGVGKEGWVHPPFLLYNSWVSTPTKLWDLEKSVEGSIHLAVRGVMDLLSSVPISLVFTCGKLTWPIPQNNSIVNEKSNQKRHSHVCPHQHVWWCGFGARRPALHMLCTPSDPWCAPEDVNVREKASCASQGQRMRQELEMLAKGTEQSGV